MTPEAADKLTPAIWASSAVAVIFLLEFIESCGTLGAHVPLWTIGTFAAVFFLKKLYHEADKFLE